MALFIDFDNAQGEYIPFFDDFLGVLNAIFAQFRDVDQAFEIVLADAGEGAELGEVGNRTFYQLAFSQVLDLFEPGVFLHAADGKANALPIPINADDLYLNFLPNFQDFVRVLDAFPRYLGEVNKPICAFNINESAEIGQAGHAACADIADIQVFQQAVFERFAGFVDGLPFRQDQAAAFAVYLDDNHGDRLTNHLAPALVGRIAAGVHPPHQAHLRCGDKTAQTTDAYDQAAFVVTGDCAFKWFAVLQQFFSIIPVHFFAGARNRQNQIAVFIFGTENVNRNFVPDLQVSAFLWLYLIELATRNDTLGFCANAYQNFRIGNFGNHTGTHFTGFGKIYS